MLRTAKILLLTLLLPPLSGMAAEREFVPYAPPFAAAGERRAVTRLHTGKSSLTLQGSALALRLFAGGDINLFSPDLKHRYGGLIVESGRKSLSGVRGEWRENACAYTYPDRPGLVQRLALLPDGRIRLELDGSGADGENGWNLSLLSEFFGGAAISVDGKEFRLPPYREKAEFFNRLHDGPARRITVFPDIPEKSFTLEFPAGCRATLVSSGGRYGVSLRLLPAAGEKKLEMILEPGTVETGASRAPAGYTLKGGQYDFWAVDRLRLPDRRAKNLLANSSFEQGFASLRFPHGGGVFSRKLWETKPIRIDDGDAYAGSASLRIASDASNAELKQNIATHPVILPPGEYTLSFYARTDRPGKQTLRLTVPELLPGSNIWDRKNYPESDFTPGAEWKRYSHTFRTETTRPQYFQFSALSPEPATCRIDAMQLERGAEATPYAPPAAEGMLKTSAPDNFLEPGRKADAKLRITAARSNDSGRVESVVRDFFGREVRRASRTFTADANGKAEVALNLEALPRGVFTVENRYVFPDGRDSYEFTRFAVTDFLDNTHPHKGMFANAYIDPYGVRQYYPEVLERYRRIGIGSRAAFANTERLVAEESAKYGIDTVSTMMLRKDTALVKGMPKPAYGLTVLNNMVWYETPSVGFRREDYASITLPGATPEKLKKIEEAAARKAAEAPWVRVWGAINEAEGLMPEFAHSRFATEENYREYVEVELAAVRGVKAGNPKALAANSATSCLRPDRFETLDKLLTTVGDRFRYDCFIVHTYREAPEYPDLDADFETLFALLARHGYPDAPVYCPEGMHWKPYRMPGLIGADWIDIPWGPFSYDMGHTERISAAWRARQWLIGLKHQNRIKLMNSSANFWGFDMDCGLTPFADQKIPNTLGRLLGDASFVREFRYSPKVRCYLFEDGEKRPVAALWSCIPAVDRGEANGPELMFSGPRPELEMFDLMEAECAFPESGKLRLTPFPLFLRGKPGSTPQLAAALEAAETEFDGEPAAGFRFTVVPPDRFNLTLSNGGRRTVAGTLEIGGRQEAVKLAPGETRAFSAALPAVLTAGRPVFESLRGILTQREPYPGQFTLSEEFSGVLARRAAITVDGATEDWNNIPALDLPSRPPADSFSAKLRIAWSPEMLFLLVEVTDPVLKVVPRGRPGQGWRNDSLQLFLDPFADGRTAERPGIGSDDWSYGFYLEADTLKPYVYRHHVPDIQLTQGFEGARADTPDTDAQCVFRQTERGYLWEIGLPLRSLLPLALKNGAQFGLGLLLNNQDSGGAAPDSRLFWETATPCNDRPELWPLVILSE